MEVQMQPREARTFSILNDNDCPSFVIRARQSSPTPSRYSSASSSPLPRGDRPSLPRQAHYTRASSFSSAGSPPLLRHSSTSSKDSDSSMDSSPSPLMPAYNYDSTMLPYPDPLLRQDLSGYLPSTTITPFLEQQMLIGGMANMAEYPAKPILPNPPALYPSLPPLQSGLALPTLSAQPSSDASAPTPSSATPIQSNPSPSTNGVPVKKNKYPCPYAQSHNCLATFTTSGHAARHGKKHTGEKGVHCPVCNKAFTRKDNMKQHERTHKSSASSSNSDDSARRSKAAVTRDAQKIKQNKQVDTSLPDVSQRSSMMRSPLSEAPSLAPTAIDTPLNASESAFYNEPGQLLLPIQTIPESVSPSSMYPPLDNDMLLPQVAHIQDPQLDKSSDIRVDDTLAPPPLIRGFSDLDTLAQAAESFNPSSSGFYQSGLFFKT